MSGGPLAERTRARIEEYSRDETIIAAARYCYNFGQDVVAVLSDPDPENLLVRIAAGQVYERDEQKREEQTRKSMRK